MAKKKEEVVTKKKVGRPKKVAEEKLETKNETIYPQGINDGGCHYVALKCNSAE